MRLPLAIDPLVLFMAPQPPARRQACQDRDILGQGLVKHAFVFGQVLWSFGFGGLAGFPDGLVVGSQAQGVGESHLLQLGQVLEYPAVDAPHDDRKLRRPAGHDTDIKCLSGLQWLRTRHGQAGAQAIQTRPHCRVQRDLDLRFGSWLQSGNLHLTIGHPVRTEDDPNFSQRCPSEIGHRQP